MHISNEYIRLLFQKVETHCTAEIYKATGKVFYPEMSTMTEWPIGGIQEPHLDTYSNQQMNAGTHEDKPAREWTCILYLNDNFKGGRTYIPDGEVYEPETGSGLLFQGIYIPHGVQKVRRHPRHTVSMWFTTDIDRTMPLYPVDDLNLNEDTIRNT